MMGPRQLHGHSLDGKRCRQPCGDSRSPAKSCPSLCHKRTLQKQSPTPTWNSPVLPDTTLSSRSLLTFAKQPRQQAQTTSLRTPNPQRRQSPPPGQARICCDSRQCINNSFAIRGGVSLFWMWQTKWQMTACGCGISLILTLLRISMSLTHRESHDRSATWIPQQAQPSSQHYYANNSHS